MNCLKPFFCLLFLFPFLLTAQPKPTPYQLEWHDMEFYLFAHFGPNTFTNQEWGHGNEPEDVFNPVNLDCEQWCRVAKAAGAKGIIITAKHHDGFCLWPSAYSKHTVRESKWKNGKGDVLRELSAACRKYGLKFGVYISPWDRNHPDYGTEKYNEVFVKMMEELFTNYGPIWELWWDGANGEGPNGKKQVYDWHRFKETVKRLSPATLVFSDVGPHIRWVGNESGIAGETNWNMLDTAGFTPGAGAPLADTLTRGNRYGKAWIPAECDVSIRPGWFYHASENDKVKTPEQLFALYVKSVGRGANLLLNVPPDDRGLIRPEDSASLAGFRKIVEEQFSQPLHPKGFVAGNIVYKDLKPKRNSECPLEKRLRQRFEPVTANCVVLKEKLDKGQDIANIRLELFNNGRRVRTVMATTVGHKRVLFFPETTFNEMLVTIPHGGKKKVTMNMELYLCTAF